MEAAFASWLPEAVLQTCSFSMRGLRDTGLGWELRARIQRGEEGKGKGTGLRVTGRRLQSWDDAARWTTGCGHLGSWRGMQQAQQLLCSVEQVCGCERLALAPHPSSQVCWISSWLQWRARLEPSLQHGVLQIAVKGAGVEAHRLTRPALSGWG